MLFLATSMNNPLISIIIRTKNEERWITFCLDMIGRQTYKNVEVILVDNQSTDNTVALAQKYPLNLVTIDKYIPGKALNDGIRASKGEFIVCVSAHCIPRDEHWLATLLKNFEDPQVAGVYGRQEPLGFSTPADQRDLVITFGLDKRIQKKDSFFHNANSMVRRSIWEQFPFDEQATNIEDRIWGKAVTQAGYSLVYEPEASVFHHHGIHQANKKPERVAGVARIIAEVEDHLELDRLPVSLDPSKLEIIAFVPVRGLPVQVGNHNLLERCIKNLKSSSWIKKVYVLGDEPSLESLCQAVGAHLIVRPPELSEKETSIDQVLAFGYRQVLSMGVVPDIVVYANYLFPFRPPALFDTLIHDVLYKGLDSVIAARPEYGPYWAKQEGSFERVDSGFASREVKQPMMQGLIGLGCASVPKFIKEGSILGERVGMVAFDDPLHSIKINSSTDHYHKKIAEVFLT